MSTITTFDGRLKAAHVGIHRALHNPEVTALVDDQTGIRYPVRRASNGCRCIDYEGTVYMEQSKTKQSRYAEAARNGAHITWGLKQSPERWVYIDDEIADAFEARAKRALADIAQTA